jgi:hypothetical protein
MNNLGEPLSPVHVVLETPSKVSTKQLTTSLVTSILPLVIIILIQKPALRKAIRLRGTQMAFRFCDWQVESWKKAMMKVGSEYNKAQL